MKKIKTISAILLCLCIFLGSVFYKKYTRKKENFADLEFSPSTWASFRDFPRLQMLLKGFGVESIIDVSSKDIQELKKHSLEIDRYIGVLDDKDQAQALQVQFGNDFRNFYHFDISKDQLPRADLILCWDELCIRPQSEVRAALVQFKKSGAKFLLIKQYPNVKKNHKNKKRIYQPINWRLPPYSFPEPIIQITEGKENSKESLALWSLENL